MEEDAAAVTRHCAFCLELCGSPAKLCGGCKKRAYCSRECQVKDWSSKGSGQRHVNWCRHHDCGEEDVDWEVVPIPNKGLGIRAKKLIPGGFRIIVEPLFTSPTGHPGINDLGPEGTSLFEKFISNSFMGENLDLKTMINVNGVALRIARVNHACQPNAAAIYDETARVAILFAQKDIQPGEEISICYYAIFFYLVPVDNPISKTIEQELHFFKNMLASDYGITCPTDCSCNDPASLALNKKGRSLHATVVALTGQWKIEEALAAGDKLLDIYRRLDVSWIYRGYIDVLLFHIAIRSSETLPRAKEYIRSSVELFRKICPYSEKLTKKYVKLMEQPETAPNYMMIDRRVQDVTSLIENL